MILVAGAMCLSWKMMELSSSMGLGWHPIYEMENKIHVWNHQPAFYLYKIKALEVVNLYWLTSRFLPSQRRLKHWWRLFGSSGKPLLVESAAIEPVRIFGIPPLLSRVHPWFDGRFPWTGVNHDMLCSNHGLFNSCCWISTFNNSRDWNIFFCHCHKQRWSG